MRWLLVILVLYTTAQVVEAGPGLFGRRAERKAERRAVRSGGGYSHSHASTYSGGYGKPTGVSAFAGSCNGGGAGPYPIQMVPIQSTTTTYGSAFAAPAGCHGSRMMVPMAAPGGCVGTPTIVMPPVSIPMPTNKPAPETPKPEVVPKGPSLGPTLGPSTSPFPPPGSLFPGANWETPVVSATRVIPPTPMPAVIVRVAPPTNAPPRPVHQMRTLAPAEQGFSSTQLVVPTAPVPLVTPPVTVYPAAVYPTATFAPPPVQYLQPAFRQPVAFAPRFRGGAVCST